MAAPISPLAVGPIGSELTAMLRFSVATPTRNALANLRRCVGSVRGQQGIVTEHLVQDAVSTDGTSAWLESQKSLDFLSEPDGGMYDAIGRAWKRATGDVFSWLNSDEQYLPGSLAKVQSFFNSHPQVDVLFGDYIVCDAIGRPVAMRKEIPFRGAYVRNGFLNAASCTLFFRRRLFDEGYLYFDTALRYAADKDLMLRLYDQGVRIDHLPDCLSLFGVDGTNLSTHEGMKREAELVRLRHGGSRNRAWRLAMSMARRVERLARGAYVPQPVSYKFALDDVPNYRTFTESRVGGRYTLSDPGEGSAP